MITCLREAADHDMLETWQCEKKYDCVALHVDICNIDEKEVSHDLGIYGLRLGILCFLGSFCLFLTDADVCRFHCHTYTNKIEGKLTCKGHFRFSPESRANARKESWKRSFLSTSSFTGFASMACSLRSCGAQTCQSPR
jgi:hypothetical protein